MITSKSNNNVKFIRQLQQRKEREQTGLFYIEGLRIVIEAIQQRAELQQLVVAPELLTSKLGQELVAEQQNQGVNYLEVSAEVFTSFSSKDNPQGIAALARQHWHLLDEIQLDAGLCWIALYKTQDTGNLGSILRTSDGVGSAGVILLDSTTDPYDLNSVRASMGAIFSQRLVRTSFAQFAAWKRQQSCFLVGTSDSASSDYRSTRYQHPLVLLMGSEPQGLPVEYQQLCDTMVTIPMVGRADSLNLAVATGIVLYEIFYQRRYEQ